MSKLLIVLALFIVFILIIANLGDGESNPSMQTPLVLSDFERSVIDEHNRARAAFNQPELEYNDLLAQSAADMSKQVCNSQVFAHRTGNVIQTDYRSDNSITLIGENLGFQEGGYDVNSLMKAWFESEPHARNIFNPEYTKIGIETNPCMGASVRNITVIHFAN